MQPPAENQFHGDRDGHIIDPFGRGYTEVERWEDTYWEQIVLLYDMPPAPNCCVSSARPTKPAPPIAAPSN